MPFIGYAEEKMCNVHNNFVFDITRNKNKICIVFSGRRNLYGHTVLNLWNPNEYAPKAKFSALLHCVI